MDFEELLSLIKIREYVVNSRANPSIERKLVGELDGILLLLDKKIVGILTGADFKDYIGYKDVQAAKEAAARITNIYSGIENKNAQFHKDIKNHK